MLRCTLSGLIPLMMSEKYSCFSEDFYRAQKGDFDKIIKTKNYYMIRYLPVPIAHQILQPEIPKILAGQKSNGLWQNSTRVTYDILSAFQHIGVLDDLVASKKLKNAPEELTNKVDYDSLLIKSAIYKRTSENDVKEINKLVQAIQKMQSENGSWEDTVVATVHQTEKLVNLGLTCNDRSVQKAIGFLFQNFNVHWAALQGSGKPYGLQSQFFFSTPNRDLEFEAAEKYYEKNDPKLICFRHLGVMQDSLCLKLLVQLGFEHDERVEASLDSVYSILKSYNSLCYFRIQKKFVAQQKKSCVDR